MGNTVFGWKALIKGYGGCAALCKDSLIPVLVSAAFTTLYCYNECVIYDKITHITSIGLSIMPAIVGLMIAAYAIMLTFLSSEKMKKSSDDGRKLIRHLNSNFAVSLMSSVFTLIGIITTSIIADMKIPIEHYQIVNVIVLFILIYLMAYTFKTMYSAIIDLYNSGQVFTL